MSRIEGGQVLAQEARQATSAHPKLTVEKTVKALKTIEKGETKANKKRNPKSPKKPQEGVEDAVRKQ